MDNEVAYREWTISETDGEYEVVCPCGYSRYLNGGCGCTECKNSGPHPITKCPECGRSVIEKEDKPLTEPDVS